VTLFVDWSLHKTLKRLDGRRRSRNNHDMCQPVFGPTHEWAGGARKAKRPETRVELLNLCPPTLAPCKHGVPLDSSILRRGNHPPGEPQTALWHWYRGQSPVKTFLPLLHWRSHPVIAPHHTDDPRMTRQVVSRAGRDTTTDSRKVLKDDDSGGSEPNIGVCKTVLFHVDSKSPRLVYRRRLRISGC
jgi:hypothetical protein